MVNQIFEEITLNIKELIEFYDCKEEGLTKPASSISGLIGEDLIAGLFKHYLENSYDFNKNEERIEIKDISIKSAGRTGKMLDRWILHQKKGGYKVAYQTEIKNWSVHSLGGKSLPPLDLKNPFQGILECAKSNFSKTWRKDELGKGGFIDKSVGKVLKLMKEDEVVKNAVIVPLVCFWMPICNEDVKSAENLSPFFEKECSNNIEINPFVNDGKFDKVYFFSASIYLRSILKNNPEKEFIDISSNNINSRINFLKNLIVKL